MRTGFNKYADIMLTFELLHNKLNSNAQRMNYLKSGAYCICLIQK